MKYRVYDVPVTAVVAMVWLFLLVLKYHRFMILETECCNRLRPKEVLVFVQRAALITSHSALVARRLFCQWLPYDIAVLRSYKKPLKSCELKCIS